ncbi:hypothetical protein RHMOL_Rhmol09G0230900 [Rhododendron molle]|uniref:Uncharacterized protein n=1 Tax=Rhododendron molle TaxID=49168 RepID=A0ACC0MGR7_RHOML|nr:hypothetical protein RHMOL_Rhmol09G0230900 [Rhododendron molle]
MGDQREEIRAKKEVLQHKKRKCLHGVCQDDEDMSGVVGTEKKVQKPQPGVSPMDCRPSVTKKEVRLLVPEDGKMISFDGLRNKSEMVRIPSKRVRNICELAILSCKRGSQFSLDLDGELILLKPATNKDIDDVLILGFRVCEPSENVDDGGKLIALLNYIHEGVGGDGGIMNPFIGRVRSLGGDWLSLKDCKLLLGDWNLADSH